MVHLVAISGLFLLLIRIIEGACGEKTVITAFLVIVVLYIKCLSKEPK